MVVAVAVAMVALDHILDGLVVEASGPGDAADGGDWLREVSDRAVAPQEQVLDLGLGQPPALDPLHDLLLRVRAPRLGAYQLTGPAGGGEVARPTAACDLLRGGAPGRYRGLGD